MISFDTHIAVPALVSAFVTLGIEWLAKPGLEARKARILGELERRRLALQTCRQILVKVGLITSLPSVEATIRAEQRTELDALNRQLQQQLVDVVLDLSSAGRQVTALASGMLMGALQSDGNLHGCVEPLEIVAWQLETARSLSPGRWFAARAARRWLVARKAQSEGEIE